jgi:uncharacterized membrane protein
MQNPPPGQGYGNQYGAAPQAAGASGKSAIGLDGNIAAALGYPIGVLAIINLVMEKENKFVRFHAIQAILFFVLWFVAVIVLFILSLVFTIIGGVIAQALGSSVGGLIIWLVSFILWLIVPLLFVALLIFAAVKAYQGQLYKLPVIGNLADKFANG